MSREWQDYIARRLDKSRTALLKAIAEVVVNEERAREKVDAEVRQKIDGLETRLCELQAQVDRLEAGAKAAPLRAVG